MSPSEMAFGDRESDIILIFFWGLAFGALTNGRKGQRALLVSSAFEDAVISQPSASQRRPSPQSDNAGTLILMFPSSKL